MQCIVIESSSSAQCVHAHDRGLLLGDGVFDTLRVVNGRALYLNAHLRRLHAAAATIGMPGVRLLANDVRTAVRHLPDGVLRLTITRGVGPRGLASPIVAQPQVVPLFFPGLPPRGRRLRLHLHGWPCNERHLLTRIKHLSRLEYVLAADAARAAGCDEALLCNTAGNLCCAAAGNLVYRLPGDRTYYTPPATDGALAGITLRRLRLRRRIVPRSLRADETTERLFVLNSVRGVCRGVRIG